MSEVKDLVQNIGDEFAEFKKANDERIKQIEEKGFASADIEKKVDEMSAGLSAIEEKAEKIQTAMNRIGSNGKIESEADQKKAEMKSAVLDYLHTGNDVQLKELSVSIDSDGGYTVYPEIAEMVKAYEAETRPIMGLVNVETISTNEWVAPADASNSATSYYIGEKETRSETDTPVLKEKRIFVTEQYAEPYLTTQIAEDSSYDIESWLTMKVRENMTEGTSLKMHTGNTTKGPRGFLTYSDGTAGWEQIEQIFSGSASGFTTDKIIDMQAALKDAYQANAVWLARRATIAELRKLKSPVTTTGGQDYLLVPDFANPGKSTMLGAQVIADPDMPAVAGSALPLAYGDFRRGYTYVNRSEISVLRNPFRTTGKVIYQIKRRNGGDVTNFEAIKLMDISAT